jgi:hypothetical protein
MDPSRLPSNGDARAPGSPGDPEAIGAAADPEAPGSPGGLDSNAGEPVEQERAGISVFPAPGTKRIKQGIVVPDEYTLPPGYVRHFQATDKGQMLRPILMFHPDYQPVDASGAPIAVPPDRVVPAALAPAGLPIEMLDVPEDAYADRGGGGAAPEEDAEDPAP